MKNKYDHDLNIQRRFIEAVWKIWETEGTEAVTTRKIAKLTGYNVSTIYLYFDNLDQIIFYASIHFLQEYAVDLPIKTHGIKDPALLYMKVCECFNQHAFRYPQAYHSIFINKFANEHNDMLERYCEIFPEEIPSNCLPFYPLIEADDLHARDHSLLLEVAKTGEISFEDVICLSIANTLLVKGMLLRYLVGIEPQKYEKAVETTTRMQARTLIGYGVRKEKLAMYL